MGVGIEYIYEDLGSLRPGRNVIGCNAIGAVTYGKAYRF